MCREVGLEASRAYAFRRQTIRMQGVQLHLRPAAAAESPPHDSRRVQTVRMQRMRI